MPAKRVNERQLDLRRHIKAAERQQVADELKERIRELKSKIRPYQILVEAAQRAIFVPYPWWRWNQERKELRQLQRRQRVLMEEIDYLQRRRLKPGGHRIFIFPAVWGYGMGDALRRERAKEAR